MLEVCGVHGAYANVLSCSHSSHKLAWIHSVNYVHVVDVIRVTSAIDATRSYRILWPCQPEVRNNIIILQTIVVVDVKLSFSKKDLVVKMECLYFCTASKIRLFASVILVMTF